MPLSSSQGLTSSRTEDLPPIQRHSVTVSNNFSNEVKSRDKKKPLYVTSSHKFQPLFYYIATCLVSKFPK
ncbi:hypothetical protein VIGAN_07081400 [Vigna angularis var. angularis]|uniref:Uncharacterized protein n=1 Tax=Vigna angularis var. angularis TaxID=157739 RepID=A0A0S3SH38_PHAAN|nr:hypothetical protein VIGAN_07081400 [Vigna angularis var. angularis]